MPKLGGLGRSATFGGGTGVVGAALFDGTGDGSAAEAGAAGVSSGVLVVSSVDDGAGVIGAEPPVSTAAEGGGGLSSRGPSAGAGDVGAGDAALGVSPLGAVDAGGLAGGVGESMIRTPRVMAPPSLDCAAAAPQPKQYAATIIPIPIAPNRMSFASCSTTLNLMVR
jgi:hypothetical protein